MKVVVRIVSLCIGALCVLGMLGAAGEIDDGKSVGYLLAVFFGMTLFLIIHSWRLDGRRARIQRRQARRASMQHRQQRIELKRKRQQQEPVRDLPYPVERAPFVTDDDYPEFTVTSGYAMPFHPHIEGGPIKHFDDEVTDVEGAQPAIPVTH